MILSRQFTIIGLGVLMFASCSETKVNRCDNIHLDNPTSTDYHVMIDDDTVHLPAYTYVSDFRAICKNGVENKNIFEREPGAHRVQVFNSAMKLIKDTTFVFPKFGGLINPTLAEYISWEVRYEVSPGDRDTTILLDGVAYTGDLYRCTGFCIPFGGGVGGDNPQLRDVHRIIVVAGNDPVNKQRLYRKPDFVVAYNDVMKPVTDSIDRPDNILPFTAMRVVTYSFPDNGQPYVFMTDEYDPKTGHFKTNVKE